MSKIAITLSIVLLFIMTISILPRDKQEVKVVGRRAIELTDGTLLITDK